MVAMKPHSIYLDYMATTPVDPRVVASMLAYLGPEGHFGNAASIQHDYGRRARSAIDASRETIADVVGALPEDIIFTSGATEANNLAILGAARFYQRQGRHLVTLATEHQSVLDVFRQLEREGFVVTYLCPDASGIVSIETLARALRPDTILVSIMHVNNEIGVIQDIAAIGDCLRDRGILFHVDAAQSIGKLPIDLNTQAIHLMSFSAHKNYGPKGVGALYVRSQPRVRLQAQSFGGGHERGLRAGTLPTHQIVGMAEAFRLSEAQRVAEQAKILRLRQTLWQGIAHLPGIQLNGCATQRIAGNINFYFPGIDGEAFLQAMPSIAVSSMSACASGIRQPSHVLRALGRSAEDSQNAIRLSIGRFTTDEEIQQTIEIICTTFSTLRSKANFS